MGVWTIVGVRAQWAAISTHGCERLPSDATREVRATHGWGNNSHGVPRASGHRDYAAFNEERTAFYAEQQLDPLPASTGIQAKLCRPELLVEIEAIAMFRNNREQ